MMVKEQGTIPEESKYHIPADAGNIDDRVNVLNHYDTFAILDRWGNVVPQGKKSQGIYHQGMRFLNRLECRVNKRKLLLLSSAIKEDNDILSVDLTNPCFAGGEIPEDSLHISRTQFLRNGVYYEELQMTNYGQDEISFLLSFAFGADFKDIFEIRGLERTSQPPKPHVAFRENEIVFTYEGLDKLKRRTRVVFSASDEPDIHRHVAVFHVRLQAHERRKLNYSILFNTEEHFISTEQQTETADFANARALNREDFIKVKSLFPEVSTSNEQFNHWIGRSQVDLLSLLTQTPYGKYPYAGVPWYNTAFGRDGIITAFEVLWLAPEIARDVVRFLSKMQATQNIPEKDAEPGKIMHETRTGEMANIGEIPFKEYYGTIDATPLYLMLAGLYYERTADLDFIKSVWPNIKAALKWIEDYGDLDKDGYLEYKHKSENGLTNQGWKDSADSIMYEDGELCEPPIALCEVQAYVYAAKMLTSRLAEAMGEPELSGKLKREAAELKIRFNKDFWDYDLGCYVLALDGSKRPCRVVSSNAGQCLFTGIVDEEKAPILAETLMSKDMFCGWGIRTLSAQEVRYNPMSYHNGSVWPHDNALIAYGLSKYGLHQHVQTVLQGLFDASLFIDLQRLPELFCGFERRNGEGPTAYPVACSPQAWSVAVVYMMLQSCLQIEINALKKRVIFNRPLLPDYFNKLHIKNLKLGDEFCDFEMFRHQRDVGFNLVQKPKDWEVIIKK